MSLKTSYLFFYNVASLAGWSYVWYLVVSHLVNHGIDGSLPTLYDRIYLPLFIAQTAALLEVFHSLLGLVRAPWFTTLVQVASRLFLLWGIIIVCPPSRHQYGFILMSLAWATSELPRYTFYAINLVGTVPGFLTYLRYSMFLILYPAGISGEVLCIISSLPYLQTNPFLRIKMPNAYNFAFDYVWFLYFILALYVPGSKIMYGYMMSQRKKILGGDATKQKKQ